MKNKFALLLVPALGIGLSAFAWGQTPPSTSYPGAKTPGTFPSATRKNTSAPRTGNNSNRDVNSTSPDASPNDKSTREKPDHGASAAPDSTRPGNSTYPGSTSGSSTTQPDR